MWPDNEDDVLTWVIRELERHKHLFTPGMEQAEPAKAGTAGTKDEEFTEYQQVREASHPSPHTLRPLNRPAPFDSHVWLASSSCPVVGGGRRDSQGG